MWDVEYPDYTGLLSAILMEKFGSIRWCVGCEFLWFTCPCSIPGYTFSLSRKAVIERLLDVISEGLV